LHIDLAVLGYQIASVLFLAGCLYRFVSWLRTRRTARCGKHQRAHSRKRGWKANIGLLVKSAVSRLLLQTFYRSPWVLRWFTHLAIFWGIVLVSGVCFGLGLGLRELFSGRPKTYRASCSTFHCSHSTSAVPSPFFAFKHHQSRGVAVACGTHTGYWAAFQDAIAGKGRPSGGTPRAVIPPSRLTVSGLLLTVSYKFLDGIGHRQLAVLHEVIVVVGLLWCLSESSFMSQQAGGRRPGRGRSKRPCKPKPLQSMWQNPLGGMDPRRSERNARSAGVQVSHIVEDVDVLTLCPPCRRHRVATVSCQVEPHGLARDTLLYAEVGRHLPTTVGTHLSTGAARGLLLPAQGATPRTRNSPADAGGNVVAACLNR